MGGTGSQDKTDDQTFPGAAVAAMALSAGVTHVIVFTLVFASHRQRGDKSPYSLIHVVIL